MAHYTPISMAEMDSFISTYTNGIYTKIRQTIGSEWCYQWEVAPALYIRVYSSIIDSQQTQQSISRAVGEDAIRVVLLWHNDSATVADKQYIPLSKAKRVHRVAGWKSNLQKRLDAWQLALTPSCPLCGSYTVERKNRKTSTLFYGCLLYPQCKGIVAYQ